MLKHTRNTNNSGIRFYKQNGLYQTCSSIQGTQITVGFVFISRFTMNNIAPKLQKCWTHKIGFKIVSKMLKQPNFLAFYTSDGHTCQVLSFYDFWFTFNDKFCSPYPIVDFLCIINHQNRKP